MDFLDGGHLFLDRSHRFFQFPHLAAKPSIFRFLETQFFPKVCDGFPIARLGHRRRVGDSMRQ